MKDEREKTLAALQNVLQSAKTLSTDVDQHNSELQSVEKSVGQMPVHADYEQTKMQLLGKIEEVMHSNTKMEDDLVYTRFRLEEQAVELDRTRAEARKDPLSGVGNRKAFDETLSFMMSKYHREGTDFALLLIDVDHFKWINDTHGHQRGDAVVKLIGETLGLGVHREDHVARYGGDEFAVFFEGVDSETAFRASTRLRTGIERTVFPVDSSGSEISVTLSMGLAVVSLEDTKETIFEKADKALYESKRLGRNRLTSFTDMQPQQPPKKKRFKRPVNQQQARPAASGTQQGQPVAKPAKPQAARPVVPQQPQKRKPVPGQQQPAARNSAARAPQKRPAPPAPPVPPQAGPSVIPNPPQPTE